MNNKQQISILGCGWLGLPLAKKLCTLGYAVKGSVRQEANIATLQSFGIQGFSIILWPKFVTGDIFDFLKNTSCLIICIPPRLRQNPTVSFTEKIKTLIAYIEQSSVKNILFISSTAVYADDNITVTEQTPPRPQTESGKQLLAAEKLLQANTHFTTTILRFAGLIGPKRHPVHFLAGKKNIANPDAPINLIHLEDCIGIIERIICGKYWGYIFNAAAPFHPTKKDYYTNLANQKQLTPPEFMDSLSSKGKIINSQKIIQTLHYTFTKRHLEDFDQ